MSDGKQKAKVGDVVLNQMNPRTEPVQSLGNYTGDLIGNKSGSDETPGSLVALRVIKIISYLFLMIRGSIGMIILIMAFQVSIFGIILASVSALSLLITQLIIIGNIEVKKDAKLYIVLSSCLNTHMVMPCYMIWYYNGVSDCWGLDMIGYTLLIAPYITGLFIWIIYIIHHFSSSASLIISITITTPIFVLLLIFAIPFCLILLVDLMVLVMDGVISYQLSRSLIM
jgi:hypothetical protein